MRDRRDAENPIARESSFSGPRRKNVECGTCGENMSAHGWRAGMLPPLHCEGSDTNETTRKVDATHHGMKTWGDCWKCKGYLGCNTCIPVSVTEIMCERCGCWATREAFVRNGALLDTIMTMRVRKGRPFLPVEEYPDDWRSARRSEESKILERAATCEDPMQALRELASLARNPDDFEDLLSSVDAQMSPGAKASVLFIVDSWRLATGSQPKHRDGVQDAAELIREIPPLEPEDYEDFR
jgi:hypothetical protein